MYELQHAHQLSTVAWPPVINCSTPINHQLQNTHQLSTAARPSIINCRTPISYQPQNGHQLSLKAKGHRFSFVFLSMIKSSKSEGTVHGLASVPSVMKSQAINFVLVPIFQITDSYLFFDMKMQIIKVAVSAVYCPGRCSR